METMTCGIGFDFRLSRDSKRHQSEEELDLTFDRKTHETTVLLPGVPVNHSKVKTGESQVYLEH